MLELSNTITALKNSLEGFSSRHKQNKESVNSETGILKLLSQRNKQTNKQNMEKREKKT